MRKAIITLTVAVGVGAGFAGGYLCHYVKAKDSLSQELGDQALRHLMDNMGVMSYQAQANQTEALSLLDVSTDQNLTLLGENSGYAKSAEWVRAKVKVLNAIALLWEKHPPFQEASWAQVSGDWVKDWKAQHESNLKLLEWARSECKAHPEYECKIATSGT